MKTSCFLLKRAMPLAIALVSASSHAVELTVSITNLTQGMAFTPRLLVAHTDQVDLFEPGQPAIRPLAWVAEAGVIDDSDNPASANSNFAYYLEVPARADQNAWRKFGGLLPPATTSANYTFETDDHPYLSLVTMLIPTNDAFAGLDRWPIPTEPGTYTVTLNAYDSGTEANDEISATRTDVVEAGTGLALGGYAVPGMAGSGNPFATNVGTGGTGVAIQVDNSVFPGELADESASREGTVHIHRNVLGDTDATGGISDLDSRVHRWLNPVARMTITVN